MGCLYCLLVIEAGSRHARIPAVTAHPGGPRTTQQTRSFLTDHGDRAADSRFLIRDRAGQLTDSSDTVLATARTRAVKIPPRSPRANACAGRLARTARTEVTGRMLIPGERHPQAIPTGYQARYNRHRPHRSRQPHPPRPDHPAADLSRDRIKPRPIPGGPINKYERAA
jgi:hypothetical protein